MIPSPLLGKGQRTTTPDEQQLLQFDLGASRLKFLLEFLGLFLGSVFLDSLRSTLDEILGLFKTQVRDGTDFLDDIDLVGTRILEDDLE